MLKLVVVCATGWLGVAGAQAAGSAPDSTLVRDSGIVEHAGIDAIYAGFSSAYRALDAASVGDLYTNTAAYLAPNQAVRTGRKEIEAGFARFFGRLRERGEKAAISFRILQRHVDERLACDVGIYTLAITPGNGTSRTDSGKFVTVAVRGNDGVWRLQVDSFSDVGR